MSRGRDNRVQRRERVLHAARTLIAEGGVEALSMRRLAAEAEVAVNTVYALLGNSREDILEALVEDGIRHLDRVLHEKEFGDPVVIGTTLVTIVVDHILEREEVFRPVLLAEAHANVGWGDVHALAQAREALEVAAQAGVLRDDADLDLLSEQIFQSFRAWSWRWAEREIDGPEFRARWLYAVQLDLVAIATDESRPTLRKSLREAERMLVRGRRRRSHK